MGDYSVNEQKIASIILGIVRSARISLVEKECFELAQRSCEISPIEWANICRAFEQFEIIHGDYWNVRNEETIKFIDSILPEEARLGAEEILGDYIMELLSSDDHNGNISSPVTGRKHSIAVLHHYQNGKAWNKLEQALKNNRILEHLYLADWRYVRFGWMQLLLIIKDLRLSKRLFI